MSGHLRPTWGRPLQATNEPAECSRCHYGSGIVLGGLVTTVCVVVLLMLCMAFGT